MKKKSAEKMKKKSAEKMKKKSAEKMFDDLNLGLYASNFSMVTPLWCF